MISNSPTTQKLSETELEGLVSKITQQVVSQLGGEESVAQRWLTDPLNDTNFRLRNSKAADLVIEHPDRLGSLPIGAKLDEAAMHSLGQAIDHTLLKPDATPQDIEELCEEAIRYKFKSVCVNPSYVSLARKLVGNSGVKVCAVVGFPLGSTLSDVKAYETRRAIEEGATEIDMVIPIGMLKAGRHQYVAHDILEVVRAAGPDIIVKVILETCLLSKEEKVVACRLSKQAGASFVKTSTGFSSGGATVADIRLMRREVGAELGVKASGGVRDQEGALEMIRSGATRIGASASVAIVCGDTPNTDGY